jgi:hypothetical protein
MRRFCFDLRDGGVLTLDEVALELSSFHAAQEEAARSQNWRGRLSGRTISMILAD